MSRHVGDMDAVETIAAWRERGADRFDPVRFHFIEVLARRAVAYGGDARRILDDKLAKLLDAYGEDLAKARWAASPADRHEGRPHCGMLGELLDHIERHASFHEERAPAGKVAPFPSFDHELRTVKQFRSTWSRLSADRRLSEALEQVPHNAGPLNSNHLIHRALTLMRELSPQYLNRFVSYVDTLLWIDKLHGGSDPAAKDVTHGNGQKKPARNRSG